MKFTKLYVNLAIFEVNKIVFYDTKIVNAIFRNQIGG